MQLDFMKIQSKVKKPLRKKDLISPNNLKEIFNEIRNHLAANAKGMTRDETLAQELINLLLCKIYDETSKKPDDMLSFYGLIDESSERPGYKKPQRSKKNGTSL